MDFKNTKISFTRSITSYSKVQSLIAALIRNRRFHIDTERVEKKEYLDIGCGPNVHDDFINLDYERRPNVDICWDVTKGIPLRAGSLSGVYSEHCFEHLPLESFSFVLKECLRVLRPGGNIRIIMPDGELYLTRYAEIVRGKSDAKLPYMEEDSFEGIYSPIMSVNRIFRLDGEHHYIYDFDFLHKLLGKTGFVDIKREGYLTGRDPKLLLDTEWRQGESLYIEASKPQEA